MGMSWCELDSHTGDAVVIAPVSRQFPANREFYRETVDFYQLGDRKCTEKHWTAAFFDPIPYSS